MEPQRVVEARDLHRRIAEAVAGRAQTRLEHAHVRGIGQRQRGAGWDRPSARRARASRCGSAPRSACESRTCRACRRGSPRSAACAAMYSRISGGAVSSMRADALVLRRKRLGRGRLRHRLLVLGARFVALERRDQLEVDLVALHRDHLARGEARAVAHAHDLVVDRPARLARAAGSTHAASGMASPAAR